MDKQALLDAIAQSGSAGKAAYDQAQAEMARQQQEAVRAALSSGIAGNAPSGAQAQLEQIISQPYQARTAQLTQNRATMQDWYNRLGASTGAWADQQQGLQQAAIAAALARATGSGGGGGGGGSDSSWYDNLRDQYGTGEIAQDTIVNEALQNAGQDWRQTGISPVEARRNYLQYVYGVPAETAAAFFPNRFGEWSTQLISSAQTPQQAKKYLGIIRQQARQASVQAPGSATGYYGQQARDYVQRQYGKKTMRRGWASARKNKRA